MPTDPVSPIRNINPIPASTNNTPISSLTPSTIAPSGINVFSNISSSVFPSSNEVSPSSLGTNISSLVNPSTISTLKSLKDNPKAFGDQLTDQAKTKIIQSVSNSPITALYKEKANLIQEGIRLDISHQLTLYKLDQQHKLYQRLSQANTDLIPPSQPTQQMLWGSSGGLTNNSLLGTTPSQFTGLSSAGMQPYGAISSILPPQLKLMDDELAYVNDTSWKGQTPDADHGKKQCESNYNGPCDMIWDGYIHNYMPQSLWERKFQSSIPSITPLSSLNLSNNTPSLSLLPNTSSSISSSISGSSSNKTAPSVGLSDEEYDKAVNNENKNYEEAKKNLQERKDKNQKDIENFLKDPFAKQKELIKKRKERRKKLKNRTKNEKKKARKELLKIVLKSAKKTLVPIITVFLVDELSKIVSQNSQIKELVDRTNAIITEANNSNDPTKLNNAKIVRDNAIRIINDTEAKITKINEQIKKISIYINIFSGIVSIISAIPIPTSIPPGIGIPVNLIIKLVKILQKANEVLLSLTSLIPIITTILDKAISILENYKSQLLDINKVLEATAAVSNDTVSPLLLNTNEATGGISFGTVSEDYKGFNFAIREESGPGSLVVRGNKRHYAVAIDTNNVEVLKSELSFTLDPNDLIEQLKVIIDRENLIA